MSDGEASVASDGYSPSIAESIGRTSNPWTDELIDPEFRTLDDVTLPEQATGRGCKCRAYVAKGLPRPGLEPVTLAPGRWDAADRDIRKLLEDFQKLSSEAASAQAPKVGAFPKFRELYKKSGASVMVEPNKREVRRDLFQFVCGVCWHHFVRFEALELKVGLIFLLHLLFHSQHPQCYAIPVTVDLLDQVKLVRDQCLEQEVFLEFPAILRQMAQQDVFSVGLRATCRNLHFDKYGYLIEREVAKGPGSQPLSSMKKPATVVKTRAPPDLSSLQARIGEYEEQNQSAKVLPKSSGPSLSQRLEPLAAAAKAYVVAHRASASSAAAASAPVVAVTDDEAAHEVPKKPRRKKHRRRVFEDSDDNDHDEAAAPKTFLSLEKELAADGTAVEVWRKKRPSESVNKLGLENARNSSDRLMQVVEEKIAAEKAAAKDKRKKRKRLRKAKEDAHPEFEDMDVD